MVVLLSLFYKGVLSIDLASVNFELFKGWFKECFGNYWEGLKATA